MLSPSCIAALLESSNIAGASPDCFNAPDPSSALLLFKSRAAAGRGHPQPRRASLLPAAATSSCCLEVQRSAVLVCAAAPESR